MTPTISKLWYGICMRSELSTISACYVWHLERKVKMRGFLYLTCPWKLFVIFTERFFKNRLFCIIWKDFTSSLVQHSIFEENFGKDLNKSLQKYARYWIWCIFSIFSRGGNHWPSCPFNDLVHFRRINVSPTKFFSDSNIFKQIYHRKLSSKYDTQYTEKKVPYRTFMV